MPSTCRGWSERWSAGRWEFTHWEPPPSLVMGVGGDASTSFTVLMALADLGDVAVVFRSFRGWLGQGMLGLLSVGKLARRGGHSTRSVVGDFTASWDGLAISRLIGT